NISLTFSNSSPSASHPLSLHDALPILSADADRADTETIPSFAWNGRWCVAGPLTVDSAGDVLVASQDVELPRTGVVSLADVRAEIGRASCRERVCRAGCGGA